MSGYASIDTYHNSILIGNALSMAADATSDTVATQGHRHVHLQIESAASGSRVGSIYVQESDNGTTWYNIPLTNRLTGDVSESISVTTLTAVGESVEIETSAAFVRVFFDYTSGTGTLNVWATVR